MLKSWWKILRLTRQSSPYFMSERILPASMLILLSEQIDWFKKKLTVVPLKCEHGHCTKKIASRVNRRPQKKSSSRRCSARRRTRRSSHLTKVWAKLNAMDETVPYSFAHFATVFHWLENGTSRRFLMMGNPFGPGGYRISTDGVWEGSNQENMTNFSHSSQICWTKRKELQLQHRQSPKDSEKPRASV